MAGWRVGWERVPFQFLRSTAVLTHTGTPGYRKKYTPIGSYIYLVRPDRYVLHFEQYSATRPIVLRQRNNSHGQPFRVPSETNNEGVSQNNELKPRKFNITFLPEQELVSPGAWGEKATEHQLTASCNPQVITLVQSWKTPPRLVLGSREISAQKLHELLLGCSWKGTFSS